ncbi:hypothetical protein [Hymenobacter cheonanensis]|uniref:hypothetical protein n=1 Tax=Hymenobacter sp. CA2-7 TaxID=3063993 RepID=UPI00271301AF|nr:hypothetical protein [Hymenobacter sp. CA2-7]MDO7884932.1 hypothetical protein [Hymenobacter sp. CA2-7]
MRFPLLCGGLLLALAARAQQPALPGAPQPPATPLPPPMRTAELPMANVIGHPGEVIGQTYTVETMGGTQFSGILREATEQTLTFETRELGTVTVQRVIVRQLTNQTPEQARRGFDYVGNSTHMFFAPTARNLHQGEGEAQVIDIFLASVNYGLTDNISVGLLVPVIPFVGVPLVAVTPKVSLPVSDKLRVGAGVLYGFTTGSGGGSGGLGYGLATYGTADTNLTLGLGYGFASDGVGRSPVGVVGANVRLSRLFTLVNETYLANFDSNGGFGGLAGLRYASPRFSGSLGALYFTSRNNGGIYPAYLDVAFRFGKIKLR